MHATSPVLDLPQVLRVIETASTSDTVYGITDASQVLTADGALPSHERTWTRLGVLADEVALGSPLLIVIDDRIMLTSAVVAECVAEVDLR